MTIRFLPSASRFFSPLYALRSTFSALHSSPCALRLPLFALRSSLCALRPAPSSPPANVKYPELFEMPESPVNTLHIYRLF